MLSLVGKLLEHKNELGRTAAVFLGLYIDVIIIMDIDTDIGEDRGTCISIVIGTSNGIGIVQI